MGYGRDVCLSQTLKDNLRLFTPEVLDRINQVVVAAGHAVVGHTTDAGLKGRCDSFVVETNVLFPLTDWILTDCFDLENLFRPRSFHKKIPPP